MAPTAARHASKTAKTSARSASWITWSAKRSARIVGSLNAMASCLPLLVLGWVRTPILTARQDGRGHASTSTGVFGEVPHETPPPEEDPSAPPVVDPAVGRQPAP